MRNILIIGSGFSGLATAYCYHSQGFSVTVWDPSSEPGGIIETAKSGFGLFESAAVGFVRTELSQSLLEFCGAEEVLPSSDIKKKFIFRNDSAQRWPLDIKETLPLLGRAGLFLLLKRMKAPQRHETVSEWGDRVLGEEARRWLLEPGLQGVYGGDSSDLSANLCLQKIFQGREFRAQKRFGVITMYPEGGMQSFLRRLKHRLKSEGVLFLNKKLTSPVREILQVDRKVIFASGWSSLRELDFRGTIFQQFLEKLNDVESVTLGSVAIVRPWDDKCSSGYGCLFPGTENFSALGVMLNSGLFRSEDSEHSVDRFIFGRQKSFRLKRDGLDKMKAKAVEDFERFTGLGRDSILEMNASLWPRALPFYGVSLEEALESQPEKSPDLELVGNFMGSVGLSDILERSHRLAIEDRKEQTR